MKRFMQLLNEMNNPNGGGFADIDPAVAKKLLPHYMDPVKHLEAQKDSLRMTPEEMQALNQIKMASQKVGQSLAVNKINITHAIDFMDLLSSLQKGPLSRIANYIDNIRGGVFSELMPFIKQVNPNPHFNQ